MPELRPAGRIDADGGAQIDLRLLKTLRTHVVPPVEIIGPPGLQRALKLLVGGKIDVVRDDVVQLDLDEAIRTDRTEVLRECIDGAHVSFPSAAARAGRRAIFCMDHWIFVRHAEHVHAPLRGLRSNRLVASDSRTSCPFWLKSRHRHLRMPRSGWLRDCRVSRTSALRVRLSFGRTGFGHLDVGDARGSERFGSRSAHCRPRAASRSSRCAIRSR